MGERKFFLDELKKLGVNDKLAEEIELMNGINEKILKMISGGINPELFTDNYLPGWWDLTDKQISNLVILSPYLSHANLVDAAKFSDDKLGLFLEIIEEYPDNPKYIYLAVKRLSPRKLSFFRYFIEQGFLNESSSYDYIASNTEDQLHLTHRLVDAGYKIEDINKYIDQMNEKSTDFAIDWKVNNPRESEIPDDVKLFNSVNMGNDAFF